MRVSLTHFFRLFRRCLCLISNRSSYLFPSLFSFFYLHQVLPPFHTPVNVVLSFHLFFFHFHSPLPYIPPQPNTGIPIPAKAIRYVGFFHPILNKKKSVLVILPDLSSRQRDRRDLSKRRVVGMCQGVFCFNCVCFFLILLPSVLIAVFSSLSLFFDCFHFPLSQDRVELASFSGTM